MFSDMKRIERDKLGSVPTVRLRAMEPEDLLFLYEMENDMSIWNVGVTTVPYSMKTLSGYIESASGDIYADKQVRMMADNERGETIGMVDLFDFSPVHLRAELGIVIKKEFRGFGYSEAIIAKVMEYAKNVVHLHQIYAFVPSDNKSSVRMLKSVGFQQSIELKDWLFDGEEYHAAYFFQIFL